MPSETDGPGRRFDPGFVVHTVASGRVLAMLLAGGFAGYGIGVIDDGTVLLPILGPVPGLLIGSAGIAVAALLYRRTGCCDGCGEQDCGCAGDCGDRCSYDA
ncbi:hypothetical protein GCM10027435_07040 [Haloparvum alkalitolerans]|uniref:hypothetical protein n=1 Tax=Haloparvum alkalitolerans TaxID=1042953 RepID=UPI003CF98005